MRDADGRTAAAALDPSPLRDRNTLSQRQDSLRQLLDNGGYEYLRGLLRGVGDVERILARVALKSARPRDLIAWPMRSPVCPMCSACSVCWTPRCYANSPGRAGTHPDICDLLRRAIVANPPQVLRDGGVIAPGHDAELDELRELSEHADRFLVELEARERQRTGIQNLKLDSTGCMVTTSKSAAPSRKRCRPTICAARPSRAPNGTSSRNCRNSEHKVLRAQEQALAREKRSTMPR